MKMLPNFNFNSSDQLSLLLFGGSLTITVKEPDIDNNGEVRFIKSGVNKGAVKLKNTHKQVYVQGMGLQPIPEWHREKKPGFYNVNEAVLHTIIKGKLIDNRIFDEGRDAIRVSELVLSIRGLEKQLNTYYNGHEELVCDLDSCIHASYNHFATKTSRLSSNNPNLQNIPDFDKTGSRVKQHFISRY